jgi:integrase/recombinase XerD
MNNNDLITKFEAFLLTEKRVSHNTFSAYKNDLQQFLTYLQTHAFEIASISSQEIKKFLAILKDQQVSPQSISRKISTLKTFFKYLASRFDIADKAAELLFPKTEKKLPHYLNEEEVELLLQTASADNSLLGVRNKVMIYLMYVTGMRVSELVMLKTSDIQLDTGMVLIAGKGGKQRMVPLPMHILTILADYMQYTRISLLKNTSSPYLFATVYAHKPKPLSRQSFWNIIKDLWKKCGKNTVISPHQLRHSLATHMLKHGADLRSLQLWLGHENLSTVQIYTHIEKSHLRTMYDKKHPRSQ